MREKKGLIFSLSKCKVINNHYISTKGRTKTMKSKVNALMITALCGLLTACNLGGRSNKNSSETSRSEQTSSEQQSSGQSSGQSSEGSGSSESSSSSSVVRDDVVHSSPYDLLNGREAKLNYETLTTTGIASLNYLKTSAAANANHFANFLDGLLTHNEFGVLELNLAESAEHDVDYKTFSFKVRHDENLVWSTYDGKPYKVAGETQYVTAADFAYGAKVVCNYSTGSDTFYLMRDFISGALEYYLYTQILDGQAQGTKTFLNLNTPAKQAAWMNKEIQNKYANVYTNGGYEDHPIEAADIENIANGSRLGVVADEEENTVTYYLMQPAVYFPTLLTYSCYLPVNEHFYTEKGSKFGGSARDSILYNGPFYLSQLDETNIVYSKNTTYAKRADIHGYNTARVNTIRYNIVKSDIDSTFTRTQFENGNIDGFSLSPNDTEGWERYVTGPDDSGTIDKPYDGVVNSRLLDTIGYAYGSNIVMERSKNSKSLDTYSSKGSADQIKNTEKALRLEAVRKAIMASYDYPTYYSRYADGDSESVFASQRLVHTYVPRNFVYDNNGNEYTQKYYAEELASKKGISADEARELITPGTWEHRYLAQSAVSAKVQDALNAINAYNASDLATKYGAISLPIQIEYFSLWYDQETKLYDSQMILEMNKRLNGVSSYADDLSDLPYFKVVPTDNVTSSNYSKCDGQETGAAAFDFSAVMWGWGADYGDPLTYLNTYTKGGDWSSIFYFISLDYVPNIKVSGANVTENDLLGHYTETVNQGKLENENITNRYTYFARAEVELIEDLAIYQPQTNDGQGWSLSISKTAGYETPTANYGLSNDRFTGMWVLKTPLTGAERASIRAEFEAAKHEYTSTHPTYNIYE